MNVCVYCASSQSIPSHFHDLAAEFGQRLGEDNRTLVYGGGSVGLMGTLARSVHTAGGRVVGYIPKKLQEIEGRAYSFADELHVTDTMSQRKRGMYTEADAFVVLPGGVGTIEEFFEVLTLKRLGYHQKPIVVANVFDFFQPLLELLEHVDREQFSTGVSTDGTYSVAMSVEDIMANLPKVV
jgi:uncharacterized protein (TIGR00730 family)